MQTSKTICFGLGAALLLASAGCASSSSKKPHVGPTKSALVTADLPPLVYDWPLNVQRYWVGPDFWANRVQDWQVRGGRLVCLTTSRRQPLRTAHCITREIVSGPEAFHVSVRLGLVAFDSLRAEDEPWLDACFVPPHHFELMAGSRSVVVFGTTGSGRTALYRALLSRCYDPSGRPIRLVADWHPAPPAEEMAADFSSVRGQMGSVFDACAVALLRHLASHPAAFHQAPRWVQDTLAWFIRSHAQGDLRARLGPLLEESDPEGTALLESLLETLPPQVLGPYVAPERVAAKLTEALGRMGIKGIWVMADVPEAWVEAEPERLRDALLAFLSTLPLFERAGFAYKLLLPSRLEPTLVHATALVRHRVDGYRLEWDTPTLRRLVERRLAFALGHDRFTLEDLCEDPGLITWLERAGGTSPREWLDQIRPLVAHYLEHGLTRPIDAETWRRLRRRHPPRIYLDEAKREVIVGGRRIPSHALPDRKSVV